MTNEDTEFIHEKMYQIFAGKQSIGFDDAYRLINSSDIESLARCANEITVRFNGNVVDVETLVNAKSGRCPEDCSFCSQSSFYNTNINKYPLLPAVEILAQAQKAKDNGATSFCIVCAYREPPEKDFQELCNTIQFVKQNVNIEINTSLGFMTAERANKLKKLGVKRYNHNLETAKSFFEKICTTHAYEDRISTAKTVKEAGLELCSGGILGMGETVEQRVELGFALQSIKPDEVPINILIGREGTPFNGFKQITEQEIIKTISTFRFLMPTSIIKIAGGREVHLKDKDKVVLKSGANGIITGGYLTTGGNQSKDDIKMINEIGLRSK